MVELPDDARTRYLTDAELALHRSECIEEVCPGHGLKYRKLAEASFDAVNPFAALVRAEALERRANAPAAASSETDVMRGRLRSRAASSGIVGEGPEMVDAFERAVRAQAAAGERRRIAAAIEDEARSDKHRTAYECRRGLFKAAEIAREVAAGSVPLPGQGEQLLADVDTLRDIAPGDSVVGDTLCEIADRVERATGSVPVATPTEPRAQLVDVIAAALCSQEESAEAEGGDSWRACATDDVAELLAGALAVAASPVPVEPPRERLSGWFDVTELPTGPSAPPAGHPEVW